MRKKEAKIERKANRARQGAVRLSELTKEQKAALISELVQEIKREEEIPASVFDNEKLSCLEAIAKYLREQKG